MTGYAWKWQENGALASFANSIMADGMEKPAGYSKERIQEIISDYSDSAIELARENANLPNIIFIMNEAWSDLRVLGNLETSEPIMPFYDSLTENVVKGNTHVSILGGITAQSEFEALTGDSLALLPSGAIPYEMQVDHDMYSLARVLSEAGYQTLAIHPNIASSWNRGEVYSYFGFDDFIDLPEFATEPDYIGNFVSDESNFEEIIYRYENKQPGQPLLLFDVTIQNHADYYFQVDTPILIEKIGETETDWEKNRDVYYDVCTYVNLMRTTDQALEKLIRYFEQVDEPVIICMFGDHQPKLKDEFYQAIYDGREMTQQEQTALKYITPYLIWSNYDSDFSEYGDMSANYLGAALLECADVPMPPYCEFLLRLREQYPVLSLIHCMDIHGNQYSIMDIWNEEEIENYRILQYNHLIEKSCNVNIFSVLGGEDNQDEAL